MKMIQPSFPRGLCLACLALPLVVQALSPAPSNPPVATTDTICAKDNPLDCYPKVFEPTADFQVIREGQDIPSGLHVRMDIYTGLKEARLNIPMEDGERPELEGVPVEQAMVIVDAETPEAPAIPEADTLSQEEAIQKALRDHRSKQQEAAGKIQPPPPTGEGVGNFQKAKLIFSMEARAFDSALDDLAELAHDIYYGVEITNDGPVLEKLVCLLLGSGSEKFHAKVNLRDQKAAVILASAIQNNPTALGKVADMGSMIFFPSCGNEYPAPEKNDFVSILQSRLGREKSPAVLKSKVAAIGGLIKDPSIRSYFLKADGMELLLSIWLKKGSEWDGTRAKVAQVVMDNFLDEDLGATTGIWPRSPALESIVCEKKGEMLKDGCWDHQVKKFLASSPNADWAEAFLKALSKERGNNAKGSMKHQEL